MEKKKTVNLVLIILILILATFLAIAGSQGGVTILGGLPLFAAAVIIAFLMQWIAFIPAYLQKTEKFYDLTGSLTYTTVILFSLGLGPRFDIRSILLSILVLIWTGRLGIFLFRRIMKAGEDKRFKEIKASGTEFFRAWTLQGLWISFTAATALAAITVPPDSDLGLFDWICLIIGLILWIVGFSFETLADNQKSHFKKNPENSGKFINTGLWSISRHPNYFGEITIWVGVALIALPTLEGWRFLTLISPVFVILLLTKISGVPLLEKRADKKWGGEKSYEEYKNKTPVLIPKWPHRS